MFKPCTQCHQIKPLSDFYTYKKGPTAKCKKCTRENVSKLRAEKLKDPNWVVKERERCRKKQARYRMLGVAAVSRGEKKMQVIRRYFEKYPEKHAAMIASQHMKKQPCSVCGNPNGQRHHEDYSKPKDVIWLCSKHHAERHVEMRREKTLALLNK